MSTEDRPILIGTSGWSYPEWDGAFYPPVPDRKRETYHVCSAQNLRDRLCQAK